MLQKAGRDQKGGLWKQGQKHQWPVGVMVMAESGQKQMEGEPAEAAGVHPAPEKFGSGRNERNGSEAWRDLARQRPGGLCSPLCWEIRSYSEPLAGSEKRASEQGNRCKV